MGVAQIQQLLIQQAGRLAAHRRLVILTGAAIGVAAFALVIRYGQLAGVAFVLALVASAAAAVLWTRLRRMEQSQAILLAQVAQLTAELARPTSSTQPEAAVPTVADEATDAPVADPVNSETADAVQDELSYATVMSTVEEDVEPAAESTNDEPQVTEAEVEITEQEPDVVVPEPIRLTEMPDFALPALNGVTYTPADFRGRPVVMVLWRPGCEHCQRLTPELVAWESLQGPDLVVFAACDAPTAYRASLPGLVLLDPSFSVGRAVGAMGTPAAWVLQPNGSTEGTIAAGASAVTALLLDAMRTWSSFDSLDEAEPFEESEQLEPTKPDSPPAVLLRRVEELVNEQDNGHGWRDAEPVRRVG